jgi:hypothetical protein
VALTARDLEDLARAKQLLSSPSLAVRVADLVGRPIERGLALLPRHAADVVQDATRAALERALEVAIASLDRTGPRLSSDRLHKVATVTTGAVGGFFGFPGLAVELPVTTTLLLRSIGSIARSEGHDLGRADVRLACLEVFALGGRSSSDDAAETGYFAVRTGLTKVVADAAQHVARHGLGARGSPLLVKLVERVAARFGIVVQEKLALEMVPAIGALGGALVNSIFTDHFQSVARGHFVVRRLEEAHGPAAVRLAWDAARADHVNSPSRPA